MVFQGQEIMPAWGGLVPALRTGRVPFEEAHPHHPGDIWSYMQVPPRAPLHVPSAAAFVRPAAVLEGTQAQAGLEA